MKKFSPSITLAACLGFALVGASLGRAQSVNPVPAPTIITSAPYTITAAGYYQLGANLNYTGSGLGFMGIVEIQANNVTLDLAGHYISGPTSTPGTELFGVHANGYQNVSVINGTIANCYEGIKFEGSSGNTNMLIQNMLITRCYGFGIYTPGTTGLDVLNCRVLTIGGSTIVSNAYGVYVEGATGVRVSDCVVDGVTASGSAYGILASSTTFVRRNNISNCATGVSGGKYQDNLTSGCTTTFTGGTDAGGNN